jgi:hypothetical protein
MAYLKYYDNRFGDMYEVYFDSDTGEFEGAMRSVGELGRESIYYDTLNEIPPFHRNQIENQIWNRLHPPLRSQQ